MRKIESFLSSCISIIYTFLIAQSNFHAERFSLCFNFSCKITQHITVVNSWRLDHGSVFSCYFRNKHVSVSLHLKATATKNFQFLIMFVSHSFAQDGILPPLSFTFQHVTCVATLWTPHHQATTLPSAHAKALAIQVQKVWQWVSQSHTIFWIHFSLWKF